jgi:hypothetical protein
MYQERKRWLQECRIAAHVRCDDAPAETRKRHQLVAPGDAAFGKSVQQKRGVVAKEPAHAARLRIHTPAILCYLRVSRPVAQQDRAAVFWRIGCPMRTRRAAPQRNVGSMMPAPRRRGRISGRPAAAMSRAAATSRSRRPISAACGWVARPRPGQSRFGRARSRASTGASGARSG